MFFSTDIHLWEKETLYWIDAIFSLLSIEKASIRAALASKQAPFSQGFLHLHLVGWEKAILLLVQLLFLPQCVLHFHSRHFYFHTPVIIFFSWKYHNSYNNNFPCIFQMLTVSQWGCHYASWSRLYIILGYRLHSYYNGNTHIWYTSFYVV